MSEILDLDPARGFVAFPVALFDLDLSPGAFRTLAELCRMANAHGQCWPSLAQLGRRLGRSRASVSGYIAELRSAGVLSTEEQKMANGYNYRLRYTVTFWQEWRSGLGKSSTHKHIETVQKPERRVQPDERPLRTKNHSHIKQTCQGVSFNLVDGWKTAVGKAPYPEFAVWPSEGLLLETKAAVVNITPTLPLISADIEVVLRMFLNKRAMVWDGGQISSALTALIATPKRLTALVSTLEAEWKPYWKKPPNIYQLTRIVESLPKTQDGTSSVKLLKSYLRRWELCQRSLPSAAIHSKVAA